MRVSHIDEQEKSRVFTVIEASTAQAASAVQRYFEGEGYRLESGSSSDGVFGIGSTWMRLLFGAFAKRYRFSVRVESAGSDVKVTLAAAMSGASGGIIGWKKMKSELARNGTNLHRALSGA